ncbi:ATP-binding cassette domain-containing protein [Kordia zhangzhouensis]|uniref:ATP-binding cassette domain-containing protein n=1 Tax=Kordia zhangzhouensis TaxID=1620405 RepID=UPI00062976FB|nr:ATP-binding cassette domain-containing protein [Kordia zhangzhouensis]
MNLFKLLYKKSKLFYIGLGFLGIVNALWASTLLLFINTKITGEALSFVSEKYDWLLYTGLIIFSFIVARYFQGYMIKLTYELGNELNLSIFNKLRLKSYTEFLNLGEEKVRTALADVATLQNFPQIFIEVFNSSIMVIIGVAYLFFVHLTGAVIVFLVLLLLVIIYSVRNVSIERDLNTTRDLANEYEENINDFLKGFREIKMSTKRNDTIYNEYLAQNRKKVKELTIKTVTKYLVNDLMGSYAGYIIIGIILFVLPAAIPMSSEARINFIVTFLYLLTPIVGLVLTLYELTKMNVAMARITEFNTTLGIQFGEKLSHGDMTDFNAQFESIRFENVTFEYYDAQKQQIFKLKPINLTIQKGESIFITGGNGSGKSTFIMLLAGLYKPIDGKIFLNNQQITEENYSYYRDQISCIFTDNYLFSENYNSFDYEKKQPELNALIKEMQLENIFQIHEEKVKTNVSKGQQKRIAFIYSMLENKNIVILDEWAAEQDPQFKAYFYNIIIPTLKKQGKTVIAVTHDDTYFHKAERIIKFNYGQIVSDVSSTVVC